MFWAIYAGSGWMAGYRGLLGGWLVYLGNQFKHDCTLAAGLQVTHVRETVSMAASILSNYTKML